MLATLTQARRDARRHRETDASSTERREKMLIAAVMGGAATVTLAWTSFLIWVAARIV